MSDDEGGKTSKETNHSPAPGEALDPSIVKENVFRIKELIKDIGFSEGFVYLFPFFDQYKLQVGLKKDALLEVTYSLSQTADKDLVAMIGPTIDPTSIELNLQRLMAFGACAKASYMTKEGEVEMFNPSKFRAHGWQKYRDSSTKPLTSAFSKLIGKYRTERSAMLKDITGAATVILPHINEVLEMLKSDKDPDRVLVDEIVTTPQVATKKKAPPPQPTVTITATNSAANSPGKMMATTRQEYRSPWARTDQHSVIDMQSVDKPGEVPATADTNRIADAVVSQVLEKLSQTSLAADGTVLRQRDTSLIGREFETRPLA
jgi:hypothetical protein